MKRITLLGLVAVGLLACSTALAQGMGGGSGSGMGMVAVAGDGSVLVTSGGGSMMGGSSSQSALANVGSNGKERWRATFTDGTPMMVASDGDLVIVVLLKRTMMTGGGMMGGRTGQGSSDQQDAILVGLALANGAERFRTTLPGDMASAPQFAPGGAQLYITTVDSGTSMMASGSMRQGSSGAWNATMKSTLVAVSRTGAILWTLDLSQGHMGM